MNLDNKQPVLKQAELTEKIIGVFYDVYNELGYGFLESVYQNAMRLALQEAGIPVSCEVHVPVWFRGQEIGRFRCDLFAGDTVLLELKTANCIERAHEAQALNYLGATEIEIALVLNFGPKPQFRRLLLTNDQKRIRENPRKSAVGGSA